MSKRPAMAGLALLAIIAGAVLLSTLLTPPPGGGSSRGAGRDPDVAGEPSPAPQSPASAVAPVDSQAVGARPGSTAPQPSEPAAKAATAGAGAPSNELRIRVRFDPPTPELALPAMALLRDGEALFGEPDGAVLVWHRDKLKLDKGGRFQLRMGFELARRTVETARERRRIVGVKQDAEHPWFVWPDKAPVIDLASAPEGPGEVTLRLRHKPRRVEVRVTDEAGRALAGARLSSQPEPYAPFFRSPGTERFAKALSGADGSGVLTLMPSKRVRIRARSGSGGYASERYDWPPPLVVPLVIKARVPAAENPEYLHLRVRAVGPDKGPVSRFRARAELIEAIPPGDQGQRFQRKTVRSIGPRKDSMATLHWRGKTGRWRVEVTTEDLTGAVEVRLDRRGVPVDVEVPLTARPRMTGVVLKPDGAPAPGAVLSLSAFGPWGFAPTKTDRYEKSDSEGRFSLPIGERDKWLRVYLAGHRQVSIAVASARSPLEIRLAPGGDVFGRLIDAQGSPAAARRVTLKIGEGKMYERTDNDGRFRFPGVPEEPLSLSVSAGPGTPSASFETIKRDQDQTFRLPPATDLELTATRGGEPLTVAAWARVVSITLDPAPNGTAYAPVVRPLRLRAGRGKLDNLPPGEYLIEIRTQPNELERSAAALLRRRLPGPDAGVPIELLPTATLTVRGPAGELRLRALPLLALPPTQDRPVVRRYLRSDERRTLEGETPETLEHLPPGEYELRFTPPGGSPLLRRVTLSPGEDRVLQLP